MTESAYSKPLYTVQPGAHVWYWSRSRGGRSQQVHGVVVSCDPWYARIQLDVPPGPILVRTVARTRLHLLGGNGTG